MPAMIEKEQYFGKYLSKMESWKGIVGSYYIQTSACNDKLMLSTVVIFLKNALPRKEEVIHIIILNTNLRIYISDSHIFT